MADKLFRSLIFKSSGADIRTAVFEDRDHIVVPVIALMEGVIHPVNADTPELVLASELEKTPDGWNGRPVVGDHPKGTGPDRISANSPTVLEKHSFGRIFNAKVEDKKLKVEAWLDVEKATKIGGDALSVLERAKNKEMIEVSVGVFVITEAANGVHNNKQYKAIWRSLVPDHLAMLPKGTVGACSNDMGCGTRTAQGKEPKQLEMWEQIKDLTTRSNATNQISDIDTRNLLDQILCANEPAFRGVEAVFNNTVVYGVMPEDSFILLQR